MMTFNTEYFVNLILDLAEGHATPEAVQMWLNKAIEAIESDYLGVQEKCESSGYYIESPDEVDFGLLGLEEYREAMGLVEEYLHIGDFECLEEAANLAVSANQNLTRASHQNDEIARDGLMDLMG